MEKVIYTKYSNDRDARFNIVTEIVENDAGTKWVCKRPFTDAAAQHVKQLADNCRILRRQYVGSAIEIADAEKCGDFVRIAWVEGEAFSEYLDQLLEEGKRKLWKRKIEEYMSCICVNKKKGGISSEAFEAIFGSAALGWDFETAENMDVDALFSNVIYRDGRWILYDCEWMMPFAVPVKFLLYRCLRYYTNTQSRIGALQEGLYEEFGITKDEQLVFEKMEENFQKYIEGDSRPMWRLYQKIHGDVVGIPSMYNLYEEQRQQCASQVFYDFGEGFSANHSRDVSVEGAQNGRSLVSLNLPEGVTALRFDPVGKPCMMRGILVTEGKGRELPFCTNGRQINEGSYLFLHDDPQILVEADGSMSQIQVEYQLSLFAGADNPAVAEMELFFTRLQQEREQRLSYRLSVACHKAAGVFRSKK